MKLGHTVKLMPPSYVKPYVRRGKNDAADAEAICEAVTRPNMRFVLVKRTDQQAVLILHRTRALLIRHRAMLANAFRAHLAEFGIIVAQGIGRVAYLLLRFRGAALQGVGDPRRLDRDPLLGEILRHLRDEVAVAGLAKIGGKDVLGVCLGTIAPTGSRCSAAHGPSSLLRRGDLEGELLLMLEACLELLLAFLDPVHFADSLGHRTAAVGNRIWRYNMAPLPRHREASTSM